MTSQQFKKLMQSLYDIRYLLKPTRDTIGDLLGYVATGRQSINTEYLDIRYPTVLNRIDKLRTYCGKAVKLAEGYGKTMAILGILIALYGTAKGLYENVRRRPNDRQTMEYAATKLAEMEEELGKATYEIKKGRKEGEEEEEESSAPVIPIIILSLLSLGYIALVSTSKTAKTIAPTLINAPIALALLGIIGVCGFVIFRKR